MKELRFDNPIYEESEGDEEVAFTITGQRTGPDGKPEPAEHRFVCVARPGAAAIDELLKPHRILDYLRLVIAPSEEARFEELLRDKDFNVQMSVMRQIYEGLTEHYAGRPTGAPEVSGPGREPTSDSSRADSSEPDSAPIDSASLN